MDQKCAELSGALIYGEGCDDWRVQTQQKALLVFSTLINRKDPSLDSKLKEICFGLLRYNLHTHKSGKYFSSDNTQWGHTLISALGIERMMHALEHIWGEIPQDLHAELKRAICNEAEYLLEYQIVAGEVENNKPESNIWNGALLHRTALLYPEHPEKKCFRKREHVY